MPTEFIQSCKQIVGPSHVLHEEREMARYHSSISGEKRKILACVRPGTVEEIQKIAQLANQHRTALYPISSGKNWGLGSSLPVRDGAVILDLGRLNRIREVNTQYGYAVVEPGVTQLQLYNYLREKQLPYALDLTGSAAETSIVGNVVEGGVGYYGLRFEQATGFELVLADGTMLHTGYGHFKNPLLKHLYRYAPGPFLEGLFTQSGLGIVTALGIALAPVQEQQASVICSLRNEKDFARFIDALGALRKNGVIPNNIKIGNYHRSRTTLCPLLHGHLKKLDASGKAPERAEVEAIFEKNFGAWSAVVPVRGSRRYAALVQEEIKQALAGMARVRVLDRKKLSWAKKLTHSLRWIPFFRNQYAVLCSVEPLFDLCRGVPTNATLPSLYWPSLDVPEDFMYPDGKPHVGMIAYLPIIPLDGTIMEMVRDTVTSIFESNGFIPNITVTMVNHKAMWGVIDMPFDRSNPETLARAKTCIALVTRTLADQGIIPQRIGIDYMSEMISEDDPYWQLVAKLKSCFDPNGILSPGRYAL